MKTLLTILLFCSQTILPASTASQDPSKFEHGNLLKLRPAPGSVVPLGTIVDELGQLLSASYKWEKIYKITKSKLREYGIYHPNKITEVAMVTPPLSPRATLLYLMQRPTKIKIEFTDAETAAYRAQKRRAALLHQA